MTAARIRWSLTWAIALVAIAVGIVSVVSASRQAEAASE